EAECKAHGCEYAKVQNGPACFMKKDKFGYKVAGYASGFNSESAFLENNYLLPPFGITPYGPQIPSPMFEVRYITEDIVRIKISDTKSQRYEVPVQNEFPLLKEMKIIDKEKLAYNVEYEKSSNILKDPFYFLIRRKADNTILFDTRIGGLILTDKYFQISSYLPSKNIYGLGEHVHPSLRHNMDYKTWPMFARDRFPEGGYTNLYGVHPFYTCLENSSNSHGVLFLNSNAMEVTLLPAPGITFRTTGGIIDMFFFVGKQPESVVNLYTSLVGKPMLPPYWSLGFQLSRYGYNSLDNVKSAVEETRKAGIPQDVQFLDIDHMEGNRDFTWRKKEFAGLQEYMHKTRDEYGLKWIIILDPAIEAVQNYSVFETGVKDKVFIKRSSSWKPEMFPDQVRKYNITFGKESGSERLSKMTLCMESVHDNGAISYRHYDVHSLYGWSQTQPTLEAAEKATGYRSLVITRSTYPSSGRYAGHWLGDNRSSWDDLRRSIIGMLEFNIFGIPYIGADVCGFNGETTAELCTRWMQLGAFYPFYRNHNGMGEKAQDPVALGADVAAASKRAVERRYALNPYLYTLFYHAHVDGSTVVRPLFHEYSLKNITLYVFPYQNSAWGDLYVDSLNSLRPIETQNYEKYDFAYAHCSLTLLRVKPDAEITFGWTLTKVHVFKVKAAQNVFLGDVFSKGNTTTFQFDAKSNVLSIDVNKKLRDIQSISWEDESKACQMLP
ncbi:Maltase-glucoamylase, intestinal, partial [Araneus ventricosus]